MCAFSNRRIHFIVVGGGEIHAPPGISVENLGWRFSLTDVYARCSALLRFTSHDGLSIMVLEALAFGRHVLWTQRFPFVRQVLTPEQIVQSLDELLTLHARGELQPQLNAAEFVRTAYDREKCVRRIVSFWESGRKAGKKSRHSSNSLRDVTESK